MAWKDFDESLRRVGPWTLGVAGASGWFMGNAREARRPAAVEQREVRGEGGPPPELELQGPGRAA